MAVPPTKFVDQRAQEYVRHIDEWNSFEAAYRADLEFAKGSLIQHPREHLDEFDGRKKRAYPLALAQQVVAARAAYLFRKPPAVTLPDGTLGDEWLDDVDLMGSDFARFVHRVATLTMIDGHTWIGVDSPRIAMQGPRTRLDDMRDGIRPYLTCYRPADVVNWFTDRFGNLEFVLIRQPQGAAVVSMQNGVPVVTGADSATFILWTSESWARLDKEGAILDTQPHPLGVVPVVPIRYEQSPTGEYIGLSLLRTIAPKIKAIINTLSLVSENHYSQTYSVLTMPADALSALLSASGAGVVQSGDKRPDAQVAIGPKRILPYHGDRAPEFISPDSSQSKTLMEWVSWAIADCYGDAKLLGRYQPEASGLSKQWDFHETNQSLRAQAANLADGLEHVLYIAGLWVGAKLDDVRVQFADDFGIESGSDILQRFGQMMLADPDPPPMVVAGFREKLARTEFGELPTDELDKMLKQIRSEEFVASGPPKPLAVVNDGME